MKRLTINPNGYPLNMHIHPQCTLPAGVEILPCTSGLIAWGDLHGDSIKLLYLLVSHGLMSISVEDYATLTELFSRKPEQFDKDDLITMLNIIELPRSRMHRGAKLILIGDEVCDRGNNDLFTLILLEKMNSEKLNFEILLSNHGMAFFLSRANNDTLTDIHPNQATSYLNYLKLKNKLHKSLGAKFDEFHEEIITGYQSKLRPIAYLEGIVFVHAPSGYELFENLDRVFFEIPDDISNTKTKKLIQLIRKKIKSMSMEEIIERIGEEVEDTPRGKRPPKFFFRYITWNRDMFNVKLFPSKNQVVHGHSMTPPYRYYPDKSPLTICIDDEHRKRINKSSVYDTNKLSVFVSDDVEAILKHNIAGIREDHPRAKAGPASAPPDIPIESELKTPAYDPIMEDNQFINQISCGCIEDQYQFLNTHPDLLDLNNPELIRFPEITTIKSNVRNDFNKVRKIGTPATLEFLANQYPNIIKVLNTEFLLLEQEIRNRIIQEVETLFEKFACKKNDPTSTLFASALESDLDVLKTLIISELDINDNDPPNMILERFKSKHLSLSNPEADRIPLGLAAEFQALINKYYPETSTQNTQTSIYP